MDLEAFTPSQKEYLVDIKGVDPRSGRDYKHKAYFAPPLPDKVELAGKTWTLVAETTHTLGKLSQASGAMPNPALFRAPTIRREAQSTSALEGTFAPFEAVMEADVNPDATAASPQLREVRNYVTAAEAALEWIVDRPISVSMLCELQRILVTGTRSEALDPGQIRTRQVIVGPEGSPIELARFVPPPPGPALEEAMRDWQAWITKEIPLPSIVSAAMAHYQFEALHPFADGNGRIGRLVIILQLVRARTLANGSLSLSPWFEARRAAYQDQLLAVSTSGDLEPWIAFFCEGVRARAEAMIEQMESLRGYQAEMRELARVGRWRGTIVHVIEDLIGRPFITARSLSTQYGVTVQAAYGVIERLTNAGVLRELTGRAYDQVFAAPRVLELLQS